jgi:hypothetical protein
VGTDNKILGGLMLHTRRKKLEELPNSATNVNANNECHASRFAAKLAAVCSGVTTLSSEQDLGGYGVDAVFNTHSALLYNPDLNATDWYNVTEGSGEMSPTAVPYGFFHYSLPGYPEGYPLLVSASSRCTHQSFNHYQNDSLL